MKTLQNIIIEKLKITSKSNNNATLPEFETNKDIEYQIVYPLGFIECFNKQTLKDYINEWTENLKQLEEEDPNNPGLSESEEELCTYEELIDLPADDKWYMLSGPCEKNGVLDCTMGIHLKRK